MTDRQSPCADYRQWPHRAIPSDLPLVDVCEYDGYDWPCPAERHERQRVRDAMTALRNQYDLMRAQHDS